jgi:hypothetical protein
MRIAVLVLLLAASTGFAQSPTAACGPAGTEFKVSLDKAPHTVSPPGADRARIYFIHDAGTLAKVPLAYPTVKVGIDGAWIGANHGDSFFWIDVAPGEHHICAALQTSMMSNRVELAHFNAEAGRTYFYRTRLVLSGAVELLELERVDSDEGAYLASQYALSKSKPKS